MQSTHGSPDPGFMCMYVRKTIHAWEISADAEVLIIGSRQKYQDWVLKASPPGQDHRLGSNG